MQNNKISKSDSDMLLYQEIVMPFLESIVYPTKRNKHKVEQTIH